MNHIARYVLLIFTAFLSASCGSGDQTTSKTTSTTIESLPKIVVHDIVRLEAVQTVSQAWALTHSLPEGMALKDAVLAWAMLYQLRQDWVEGNKPIAIYSPFYGTIETYDNINVWIRSSEHEEYRLMINPVKLDKSKFKVGESVKAGSVIGTFSGSRNNPIAITVLREDENGLLFVAYPALMADHVFEKYFLYSIQRREDLIGNNGIMGMKETIPLNP